jgi:hypothetical protein
MRSITLSLAVLSLLAGCSSEPTRYPITGTVVIDDRPAPLTTIRFIPTGNTSPMYGGVVNADSEGNFALGEEGKNTGLPAGEYKVTFSQTLIGNKPTLGGGGGKASERLETEQEGVPEAYRDPENTPVSVTVGSSSRTFTLEIRKD